MLYCVQNLTVWRNLNGLKCLESKYIIQLTVLLELQTEVQTSKHFIVAHVQNIFLTLIAK